MDDNLFDSVHNMSYSWHGFCWRNNAILYILLNNWRMLLCSSSSYFSRLWDLLLKYAHESNKDIWWVSDEEDLAGGTTRVSERDEDPEINRLKDFRSHAYGSVNTDDDLMVMSVVYLWLVMRESKYCCGLVKFWLFFFFNCRSKMMRSTVYQLLLNLSPTGSMMMKNLLKTFNHFKVSPPHHLRQIQRKC